MRKLERKLFFALYELGERHVVIGRLAGALAMYAPYFFAAVYAALAVFLSVTRDVRRGMFIAVPAFCMLSCYAIKYIVRKKRPSSVYALKLAAPFDSKKGYSFPSNHSAAAVVIAFACGFWSPALGAVMFGLGLAAGLARVVKGLHFFSDVMLGFAIGAIFGVLGFWLLPYLPAP